MYIELFLLDNILMNLLMLRLACALLSVKLSGLKGFIISFLGALYAAFGVASSPFLLSPVMKLVTLLLMALALPFHSLKTYGIAVAALFFSAVVTGGTVLLIAICGGGSVDGGTIYAGIPLRTMLIGALAASFLPRLVRRILSRRVSDGSLVRLSICDFGCEVECAALVDTGCLLTEPVTGLPVVIINKKKYPLLADRAVLPVPIHTASGEGMLFAVIPTSVCINGTEVSAAVAFADVNTPLVPPTLLSGIIKEGDIKNADTNPKPTDTSL